MVPRACPVCDAGDAKPFEAYWDPIGQENYAILSCQNCELVFSQPLRFPGGSWYDKYNYVCGYAETASAAKKGRFPHFLDRLPSPHQGRILDVGCASGQFLKMASQRGYEVEGLDVDSRFVALAHAEGLSGVRLGTLDSEFARRNTTSYEAVSLMEILEHVDDPRGFLGLARDILKPGGHLFVSVPDNRRPTPFGRDIWDYPPHHLSRWGPKALRLVLERSGFIVEDLRSSPLPTAEFSRIWADRSAQFLLHVIKRVLFGAGAAGRPMDDLLQAAPQSRPKTADCLPDKMTRVRLVSLYQTAFRALAYPVFCFMPLYYRWTKPGAGLGLLAVARKNG